MWSLWRSSLRLCGCRILSVQPTVTNMELFLFLFNLGFLFWSGECFNLETSRPIIYEMPEHLNGDYFGMSVAIRPKAAFLNNSWSIQIGAPRGHGGEGAVYRCNTYGPCRMFPIGEDLATQNGLGVYQFKEKKDAAWIGVAMDIRSFHSHETSVVCGHRWMNQELRNPENIDITYLVTGVCYLQNLFNGTSESAIRRLLPLVNKDKIYTPKPYVVDVSTYHWGLGQAGISVRLTDESENFLLIGAPGVTHWVGSVIRYEEGNLEKAVGNFARTEISRRSRYPYLGYSVTFGRFYKDKENWFVAGAPRSANYRGEIFTFQFKDPSDEVRIRTNLMGATFGEYFGSSLATGDLNGDGVDDLIVGAPLFSNKGPDEGRIYVYLGTTRGNFLVPAQVINGRASQSRFGSSLSSIKDLDQDGYDDVAVGAPYEDDRKGAVYIYRGSPRGLQTDYSQRIRAQDIHPHLRGFGVSISPAVDIDGNKYLDIAVGSYLSGHVVLLRSRPVVSLHPSIKTENTSLIDRRDSYFNVTVCSRYAGSNAPEHVDVVRTVDVDPLYGRGRLQQGGSQYRKKIRLRKNQIICEIHQILVDISRKNFSPLQIIVKNEIDSCLNGKGSSLLIRETYTTEKEDFPKDCPMGNAAETSTEIAFAGICGPDLTCRSDLELSCTVPELESGFYTLGSSEFLILSMNVKNHGEPAYNTKIKIWSNLKLKTREPETSTEASRRIFWLDHEGILIENYKTNFSFFIDLDAASSETTGETQLNLIVEIFTSSLEANLNNNKCKFSVKLQSNAFLNLFASSSIASAYVTKTAALQNQTLNVTHYYEVQKTGVTPAKDVELTIYIPFFFIKEFLTYEVETADWMHFSLQNENFFQKSAFSDGDEDHLGHVTSKENCPPDNRTLFLNCSTVGNKCDILKIFFSKKIPVGFSSFVKIIMSFNLTAIESVKMEKDIVYLSTTGVLKFSTFFGREPTEIQRSASISLYNEESARQVDAHVIALSILAGGFLFFLIVTALVKSNFFKRAKKQELKELRNGEANFVYFANQSKFPNVTSSEDLGGCSAGL